MIGRSTHHFSYFSALMLLLKINPLAIYRSHSLERAVSGPCLSAFICG